MFTICHKQQMPVECLFIRNCVLCDECEEYQVKHIVAQITSYAAVLYLYILRNFNVIIIINVVVMLENISYGTINEVLLY